MWSDEALQQLRSDGLDFHDSGRQPRLSSIGRNMLISSSVYESIPASGIVEG
jgi:hypothetical protein